MAWDRTKPVASVNVESPAIRANMQAIDQAMWGRNLVCDSEFLIWHLRNRMAHWTFSGTGALSRETSIIKGQKHSAKVVYGGSGVDVLTQQFLRNAATAGYFAGIPFSAGCWIKCNTVSCSLQISDFVASTLSLSNGTNTWEWVTVTHTVDASPIKLQLAMRLSGAGTAYYSRPTFVLGPIPPKHPIPSHVIMSMLPYQIVGNPPSTGDKLKLHLPRPFMVVDCMLEALSINKSTTPLILDIFQHPAAGQVSMFKSADRPTIATGIARGSGQPSRSATATGDYAGAYHHSCFRPGFNSSAPAGGQITLRVADALVTTGAKNTVAQIRYLEFPNPWEAYSSFDEYK